MSLIETRPAMSELTHGLDEHHRQLGAISESDDSASSLEDDDADDAEYGNAGHVHVTHEHNNPIHLDDDDDDDEDDSDEHQQSNTTPKIDNNTSSSLPVPASSSENGSKKVSFQQTEFIVQRYDDDDDDEEEEGEDGRRNSSSTLNTKAALPPISGEHGSNKSTEKLTRKKKKVKRSSMTMSRTLQPTRNKIVNVSIMINRNLNIPKRQVMMDPRRTPNMDKFMDLVTQQLEPEFGLVRRIHDAESGQEITDIKQLQANHLYVACGMKAFRKLDYLNVQDYKHRDDGASSSSPKLIKRKLTKKNAHTSSRFLSQIDKPLTIMVVHNGDDSGNHVKVLLNKRNRANFVKLLEVVTDKMKDFVKYDVKQLYHLQSGNEVTRVDQLIDLKEGGIYIAVDKPPFIPSKLTVSDDYDLIVPQLETSPKHHQHHQKKSKFKPAMLKREVSMFQTDTYVKALQALNRQKASLALTVLLEELVLEASIDYFTEMMQHADRLCSDAKELISKRQGHNISHDFDHLVPNIIAFMLQPQSEETWQTSQGDALDQFAKTCIAASKGQLRHWEGEPEALAALLITLDQFPRSMYDDMNMYSLEDLAYEVVLRAIQSEMLEQLPPIHQLFACFALTHQERLEAQILCVETWENIRDEFPTDHPVHETARSFYENKEIIEKFGRFPDRNNVLSREWSEEEKAYIEEKSRAVSKQNKRDGPLRRASKTFLSAFRSNKSKSTS